MLDVITSHQIEVVIIVDLQLIGTLMLVTHHLHIVLELGVDVVPRVWHRHLATIGSSSISGSDAVFALLSRHLGTKSTHISDLFGLPSRHLAPRSSTWHPTRHVTKQHDNAKQQ